MNWLDEVLPVVKAQAKAKVASELQAAVRADLPRYLSRLKRHAKKNPVAASIVSVLKDDRGQAAAFFMQNVIARDHLRKFIRSQIVREVEYQEGLFGCVDPASVIDEVVRACEIALTSYPRGAQPQIPRRCDIGRMVRRYLLRGRI